MRFHAPASGDPRRLSRRPRFRRTLAGLALTALAALPLAGCAGDEPLSGGTAAAPAAQAATPSVFPTVGTPAPKQEPLSPEAQAKLQKELERLARTQEK